MITVSQSELGATRMAAVIRPVTAEWEAVTPTMRRLELAAGAELETQCRRMGELPVGSAVITGAGDLAADFMVHVVVRSAEEPVTVAGIERGLRNGLRRVTEWGISSVALAPLGTGAGNLDLEQAAAVIVPILQEHMRNAAYPSRLEIVVDSPYECEVFSRALGRGPAGPAVPSASDGP